MGPWMGVGGRQWSHKETEDRIGACLIAVVIVVFGFLCTVSWNYVWLVELTHNIS